MQVNEAAKKAQYQEFFMNPKGRNGGRRKNRLGASSMMDELLLGRDTDCSGEDPHKEFMGKFGESAGIRSGQIAEAKKKSGVSMNSVMDDVIWGRDFDRSGQDGYEAFMPPSAAMRDTLLLTVM
jgi:hypothetical protein